MIGVVSEQQASSPSGAIFFGTSGWLHHQWRGSFYPEDAPAEAWLATYSEEFSSVEVVASAHVMPEPVELTLWRSVTGGRLKFLLRAPRTITHTKKLKNCELELQMLLSRAALLESALGPIIFELPAHWRLNLPRLQTFLQTIPKGQQLAFDCPHPSWHCADVYDLLRHHGVGCCVRGGDSPEPVPAYRAQSIIIRLQGPRNTTSGHYRTETLRKWVDETLAWNRSGKDVYLLFDSDDALYSMKNARRFRGLLKDPTLQIPQQTIGGSLSDSDQ